MTTARKGVPVTPDATNPLPEGTADALQVGGGGTVIVRHPGEPADCTWTVPDGGYVLARVSHVRTGGTATNITALYE